MANTNTRKVFRYKLRPLVRCSSDYPSLSAIRKGTLYRVPEFRGKYEAVDFGPERKLGEIVSVEGRVSGVRRSGRGMMFVDLVQDTARLQLIFNAKNIARESGSDVEAVKTAMAEMALHPNTSVTTSGHPGVSKSNELSLVSNTLPLVLSPALEPLPNGLSDPAKTRSHRTLDYLVNQGHDVLIVRAKIMKSLRKYLDSRGFTEVETPILSHLSNGANARPFVTKATGNLDLQLRVAPELWLKRLIIGGMDKVYEIGKVFRNEGVDMTHNPEFSTLEFYQSFLDMEQLIAMTHEMLTDVCSTVKTPVAEKFLVELAAGFKRLEFLPTIERESGVPMPAELTQQSLIDYYHQCGLPLPEIQSPAHLLDKLCEKYIEPLCQDSWTVVYHHPEVLSPLSKSVTLSYNDKQYRIAKRFELYHSGVEYANAYEEENSPRDQHAKFLTQVEAREQGDAEGLPMDNGYVKSMELGMPPTGGFGLGIDRLCVALSGRSRLGDVLSFGGINDVIRQ